MDSVARPNSRMHAPFSWLLRLCFLPVVLTLWSCSDRESWQVKRVTDGDTIVLVRGNQEEKVRLLSIDAPEKSQKPWGPRSKEYLEQSVRGGQVRVETDVRPRDKYNRLLAHIWVGDKHLNRELVASGNAVLYTVPPNVKYTEQLQQAQVEARRAERGVWDRRNPLRQSPAEYRKRNRN